MLFRISCLIGAVVCLLPSPAHAQRLKLPVKLPELVARARADSADPAAHYNAALGYWNERRFAEADSALRRATSLDARFASAWLARAYLPFAERKQLWNEVLDGRIPAEWIERVRESDRFYRRAFMIDPFVDLRIAGTIVPGRSALWDADDALSRVYEEWVSAFDDFRDGNYEAAYLKLDRMVGALAIGKDRLANVPGGILWFHGLAAAQVGRFQFAIEDFEALLARTLEYEKTDRLVYAPLEANHHRYVLGVLQQRAGARGSATQLFREALANDLGLYMAHVRLAELHETAGLLEDAVAERQRAIDSNVEDPTLLHDLAGTLVKLGRVAEAEAALVRSIAMNPSDPRPYYMNGLVQLHLGKRAEAAASFEAFVARAPSRYAEQVADARQRLDAVSNR